MPLTERGRSDLARAIQVKLNEFERHKLWQQEKDWKGFIKRFDRQFLRGALYQSYRATRRAVRARTSLPQVLMGTAAGLGTCVQMLGGLV